MFTPMNIQVALEGLFDLCDPEKMENMLENYGEEFEDIDSDILAHSFMHNAEMVCEYRVLSSAGDGIDYQGSALLENRAVKLLTYELDRTGDDRVFTIQNKELWFEENMSFSVVSCIGTYVMEKNELICLTEHRSFVTAVDSEDEMFFDIEDLVCELDDICMFDLLLDTDAADCEE